MPRDANTKVMLYEVYQDEAAYDAHSKGPSIARLREEAAGMIVTVSGTRGTLLE
jgi:quinol monooxygenase YgiN